MVATHATKGPAAVRRLEISGQIEDGMWDYRPVYPPVAVEELPRPSWGVGEGEVISQVLHLGGQSASSVATAGHLFPDSPDIADIPLDRLILSTVLLELDVKEGETIGLPAVLEALDRSGETLRPGDGLLLATGWARYWNKPEFLAESPGLSNELANWVADQRLGLLGSDIPMYDPSWREGKVLPTIYASGTLVMAPLVNLTGHGVSRARLYALPLSVKGACAAPCRAFLEVEENGATK